MDSFKNDNIRTKPSENQIYIRNDIALIKEKYNIGSKYM